jgi:NCAIR mutase (PurE)-related protein
MQQQQAQVNDAHLLKKLQVRNHCHQGDGEAGDAKQHASHGIDARREPMKVLAETVDKVAKNQARIVQVEQWFRRKKPQHIVRRHDKKRCDGQAGQSRIHIQAVARFPVHQQKKRAESEGQCGCKQPEFCAMELLPDQAGVLG